MVLYVTMGFQLWIFLVGLLCADHATGLFMGSCWEVCKEFKKKLFLDLYMLLSSVDFQN